MLDPTNDVAARFRVLLTALLLCIVVVSVLDLMQDSPAILTPLHLATELLLLGLSAGSIGYLWLGWMRERRALVGVRASLDVQREDRDVWRSRAEKLLRGLGDEIDAQLRAWGLTPAERDTALLVLKGYGHREIAELLDKSERTVRQQAGAVYQKSGLSGRAELSAFFLEDLLLPADDPAATPDRR